MHLIKSCFNFFWHYNNFLFASYFLFNFTVEIILTFGFNPIPYYDDMLLFVFIISYSLVSVQTKYLYTMHNLRCFKVSIHQSLLYTMPMQPRWATICLYVCHKYLQVTTYQYPRVFSYNWHGVWICELYAPSIIMTSYLGTFGLSPSPEGKRRLPYTNRF